MGNQLAQKPIRYNYKRIFTSSDDQKLASTTSDMFACMDVFIITSSAICWHVGTSGFTTV